LVRHDCITEKDFKVKRIEYLSTNAWRKRRRGSDAARVQIGRIFANAYESDKERNNNRERKTPL
jgi:hypothetical protein